MKGKEEVGELWSEIAPKIDDIFYGFAEKESTTVSDCCAAASTIAEKYLAIAILAGADAEFIISEARKKERTL